MNRTAFFKLCEMLESLGGLKSSRNMLVDEQVAMFLHIISHHLKNRVIKHHFRRFGETVSRAFHSVLNAVIRLQDMLFKKTEPISADSSDTRWKWFKNCLGALDRTHIKIRVLTVDKPRYRTRKGDIATNMLGVSTPDMQFVYVLLGWEGLVADGRVLRDAISRRHGLKVPHGCYYLVNAGYTNCEGFLAPFRGQRYHLNEWRQGYQPSSSQEFFNIKHASARCYYLVNAGYTNCEGFLAPFRGQRYHLNEWRQGYQPSSSQEFFNIKHASARNVIERCFELLKLRWGILRSPSFYPVFQNQMLLLKLLDEPKENGFQKKMWHWFPAWWTCTMLEHLMLIPGSKPAKPNIESRIRLLKIEWSIIYDMLNGQNNSGFSWDEHRQLVVAEDAVWDTYLKSHKEAAQFRHRSFPYYDQFTAIYARDRATGKDDQTAADVLEEINAEGVPTTYMDEERNSFYNCEADVSLDDMDVSIAEPRRDRDQGASSSSNKRKKKSDARDNMSSSFDEVATLLAENMRVIGDQISRSIASDVVVQQKSEEFQIIQEKATNLYSTLWEIEGLTDDERYRALSKIPDHPTQMLVFFSLPSAARLEWVRRFLSDH
ncbi:hypothetical protein GOBAR_DD16385 [Gossypium barbadense]|nr:hypothetical protein GOBAR_DD16385 [Gossypium barbadense]